MHGGKINLEGGAPVVRITFSSSGEASRKAGGSCFEPRIALVSKGSTRREAAGFPDDGALLRAASLG
jgi:hypothetical protein